MNILEAVADGHQWDEKQFTVTRSERTHGRNVGSQVFSVNPDTEVEQTHIIDVLEQGYAGPEFADKLDASAQTPVETCAYQGVPDVFWYSVTL